MDKTATLAIIDKLLILQDRDTKTSRLLREMADIPERKTTVQTQLDRYHAAVKDGQSAVKTRQANVKKIELEVESFRQQILKLREQQFQIKSNEEYKALNKEIAHIEGKIRKQEDREIGAMEEVEMAQAGVAAAGKTLAQEESRIREELQTLDVRGRNIETEIDALKKEREALVVGLDAAWLDRYNRVIENKKDAALVQIEKTNCGGCHMKLPAQTIQDVKRAESIVNCIFCGRILYWMG
ncbi:MAG: hypothetical protein HY343_06795 [Lentisphaerae bacterium]|nr:hypothetical protein [Lentisphaerota bacterium]